MNELAIHGGRSVRDGRPWPAWPRFDAGTEDAVLEVLRARRWTLSWPGAGEVARERLFAEAFADFHDVPRAIALDHGSTALTVAMELLDIGPGDEVIVPAVTWVATASAVLRVGALPILADVDRDTGCLDPSAVSERLSSATRAIICVHLACTAADLAALIEVAGKAGVPLIEDTAQAHGGIWRGRRLGTWGSLGTFSFQSGKVLAAGEGGAVLLHDDAQWERAQQLRADSRSYAESGSGRMELVESGDVIGANRTMTEFAAAILLDRLPLLDAEHVEREGQASAIELGLADGGVPVVAVPVPEGMTQRSIYEYALQYGPGAFAGVDNTTIAAALTAELERPVYPPDAPLFKNVLFRPETLRRYGSIWTPARRMRSFMGNFFGAQEYAQRTLLFHHSALLGSEQDASDVVTAMAKVHRAASSGQLVAV